MLHIRIDLFSTSAHSWNHCTVYSPDGERLLVQFPTASSDAFALKVTLLSLGNLYSAYVPVITTPTRWSEGSLRIRAEESTGIKDKMDK